MNHMFLVSSNHQPRMKAARLTDGLLSFLQDLQELRNGHVHGGGKLAISAAQTANVIGVTLHPTPSFESSEVHPKWFKRLR
jgi:hypothetical protein